MQESMKNQERKMKKKAKEVIKDAIATGCVYAGGCIMGANSIKELNILILMFGLGLVSMGSWRTIHGVKEDGKTND